ncbi:PhnD/SsuA/transferrin family substrate-binding protein [Lelliottia sp. V89_10]|uniref:phosphate/phosphite/phosphonate ABC transporter substrate-binding protein n=1 Tax=Lelliottia wanjuensis TaxID=3050585 RepID=UPI00249D94FB|nr:MULTISPECIES: PhnD/SsuA/transferrin family substrate-binding protein [unclassified Lelliottia]MDI3362103.1 PhnD/SsuA/transferrin family substrate-binding protein [Lelliottia sp. V89_13]MDK9547928.1 PhnD/SsuA/transferrin family substrate-binding protein [Lelliottia sp. V89_5]MDK9596892.1 PhnD/SsuA/transferrin family substrate-binding protein [Lelliottia sp. V89_10]
MTNTLAFPMYGVNQADNERLWQAVQRLLLERGLAVSGWSGEDLLAHWQSGDLLLSQTCGFPLVTQLPEVKTVGCFHYTAPGCEGLHYRSFMVARVADAGKTLADFRGQRAVCNSVDSQSGYNALRKMVAPLAEQGQFFAQTSLSGSHRQSLKALAEGRADIAAIDCVTWALLQRHEPELVEGLSVVGETPLAPGLPLITAGEASTVELLRDALRALVSDPQYRSVCEAMLIGGFSAVSREPYSLLLAWRDEAAELGVTRI